MKKKSMNVWRMMSVILNNELNENHLIITDYLLSEDILCSLKNRDWSSLDNYFLKAEKKSGELFSFLSNDSNLTNAFFILCLLEKFFLSCIKIFKCSISSCLISDKGVSFVLITI